MKVLFFAQLREAAGTEAAELDVDEVATDGLWELLVSRWPELGPHRRNVRLARNGVYAAAGEIFSDQDEVALIPPVSGG